MDVITIFMIAVALAVDAFAVAIATGAVLTHLSLRHTFRLSWHFGLFQAGMNVIGWAGGLTFRSLIERVDHWLAFVLLLFVGGRMIIEALKSGEETFRDLDPTRGRMLIILSVATSIDALAVGLSFSMLNIGIWVPAMIIGVVATAFTIAGLHLGNFMGTRWGLGPKCEIAGGLVLVGIGIKILQEHGVF
jgi:manganese efflux pump family protein